MSNTDTSSSARTRQRKAQALAAYAAANPGAREGGGSRSMDASMQIARVPGSYPVVRLIDTKPAIVEDGCCASAPVVNTCVAVSAPTNVSATYVSEVSGFWTYTISWTRGAGATSHTLSSTWPDATFSAITNSSATMTFTWPFEGNTDNPPVTVTAVNSCSSASANPIDTNPCFLAGSLVAMADGTTKAIEDVRVGDAVVGAFGEINYVLALHRPLLRSARMIRINEEHSSTAHHPHISTDKQFYCDDIDAVEERTYGQEHDVIDATGATVKLMLHGLRKGRVQKYTMGIQLQTVAGPRTLETLTSYNLPSDTQLYNLVVSGSHTYCVDGYAVTGWPREDDFDYDSWEARTV